MALSIKKTLAVATVVAFAGTGASYAAPIFDTLPEVNGGNGYIGDFTYSVPVGESVTSLTVSGTWGNSQNVTSGALTLFLDTIQVGQGVANTACWNTPGPDAWSYTFSAADLATGFFDDGAASLVQNATSGFTRLGSLTLRGETSASVPVPQVPVPVAAWFFGPALLGLAGLRKIKK